jgi:hypothetical protein
MNLRGPTVEFRFAKAAPAYPASSRALKAHGSAIAREPHASVAFAGRASATFPLVMTSKPPFGLERRTAYDYSRLRIMREQRASENMCERAGVQLPPEVYDALCSSDSGSDRVESMRTKNPVCAGRSTSFPFLATT